MENIFFKNKRQKKDFDFLYKNVYFDIEKIKMNKFNDCLIDIANLSKEEVEEVKRITENKKTIIVNEIRKKIVII